MHEYAVALAAELHRRAAQHLLRKDGQEDLCFALYHPCTGATRWTALLYDLVLPQRGDREVHGNAAFHSAYIRRALARAEEEKAGQRRAYSDFELRLRWQANAVQQVLKA